MYKESLILAALAVSAASGLYSGFGGVVGNLTPRTGSSWPPYPGAGRGYWANRAGFYGGGGRAGGYDYANSRDFANRRPKRSPLYAGFGGVVGELTPRTGPSSPSGGSATHSEYNRSRYAAARSAAKYSSGRSSSRRKSNRRKSYRSRYSYYRGSGFTGYRGFRG